MGDLPGPRQQDKSQVTLHIIMTLQFSRLKNYNQALGDQLEAEWSKEQVKSKDGKGRASLGGALLRCFGQRYVFLGVFTLLEECAFRIAQPLFMGETDHLFDFNIVHVCMSLNQVG